MGGSHQAARGALPSAPSGSLKLHGILDGAPLGTRCIARRGAGSALRVLVGAADWKSVHAAGGVDVSTCAHGGEPRKDDALSGESRRSRPLAQREPRGRRHRQRRVHARRGRRADAIYFDQQQIFRRVVPGRRRARWARPGRPVALELAVHMPRDLYGAGEPCIERSPPNSASDMIMTAASLPVSRRGAEASDVELAKGIALKCRAELGMRTEACSHSMASSGPRSTCAHRCVIVEPALVNAFRFPSFSGRGHDRGADPAWQPTGHIFLGCRAERQRPANQAMRTPQGIPPIDLRAAATLAMGWAAREVELSAAGTSLLKDFGEVPLRSQGNLGVRKVAGSSTSLSRERAAGGARHVQASGQLAVNVAITGPPHDKALSGRAKRSGTGKMARLQCAA